MVDEVNWGLYREELPTYETPLKNLGDGGRDGGEQDANTYYKFDRTKCLARDWRKMGIEIKQIN